MTTTNHIKRVRIHVSGRVQGVFFRASTQKQARHLNILGSARNLPDGRVEIVAEGESEAIARFLSWCRKGPPGAEVTSLKLSEEPVRNEFTAFEIRY